MRHTRREFITTAGAMATTLALPKWMRGAEKGPDKKRHIVTLSFDDGFKKSFLRTAEICEKHTLSACLNVIATGHQTTYRAPGKYIGGSPRGDFGLWNELKARGHEIMPHGYKHANLRQLPFEEAKPMRPFGFVVLAILTSATAAHSQDDLSSPPEGKTWKLVWHDEFEGTKLDETKWVVPPDGPRRDGWWMRKAISLEGKPT